MVDDGAASGLGARGGELCEGFVVALWRCGQLRVADGCPVAAKIDRVHDGQGATYAEAKAK